MTNSKHTKRALLMSVLSMLLCCTMLIGSTFAWFTDSVTSGANKIVAGNLDVELYNVKGGKEIPVTAETNLFLKDALWEPGHVEVINLKVENKGSLALQYKLGINVASEKSGTNVLGETFNLSDYIMFALIDGNNTYATREEAVSAAEKTAVKLSELAVNKGEVLYPAGTEGKTSESYVTLIVYMPTTVDNKANYKTGTDKPEINLGVNLVATQAVAESDGFGNEYDDIGFISNAENLISALRDGGTYILTDDITLDENLISVEKNTTINLNGHTLDASQNSSRPFVMSSDSSLTINGSNETVKMGKYGLVNIPSGISQATITINGGNYVGKTDNGAMIKPRGTGDITVNLNDVTLNDDSDNGSWAVNGADYYGDNLTVNVNGGEYNCFNGFNCAQHLTLTNVTMNIKHRAVAATMLLILLSLTAVPLTLPMKAMSR